MTWADLFERGADYPTDVKTIREALATRRDGASEAGNGSEDEDA